MLPQLWPFVLEGGGQQTRFQAEGFWYQPDVQHLERRELDKHIHDTVVVAFSFFFFFLYARIWGEGSTNHSLPLFFFSSGDSSSTSVSHFIFI